LGENNITGSLDLNLSGKKLQLATELASAKFTLQPVTLPALETLSRVKDLGPLKLKLNLTDAGSTLALGNLDLSVGREEIILLLLKGKISDLSAVKGMDLTFTIKGRDITKVTGAGGSQMNSKGAFQFSGQFSDPAPKVYRLPVFEAVWGDSQSSGSLELDTSGQRPRLKAELSSDKLDLRPFLKPLQNKGAAEPQSAKGGLPTEKKSKANRPAAKPATRQNRVFSADPLPLAELQKIDAEVKFRGKQVLLQTMAFENIVGSQWQKRWLIAFAFGLVHGFGFSFALSETLQFAGTHLLTSLLAFNLGVEIGQLVVILLAVPVLNYLFKHLLAERMGTILLSAILAHSGWHWMSDRASQLSAYSFQMPPASYAFFASVTRWLMLLVIIGGIVWVLNLVYGRYLQNNGNAGL